MRKIRLLALFAMVLVLTSATVWAVGKQTVDPNSGRSLPAVEAELRPAADQKVSYSARNKMLYQIVDDLAKMTDTKLYAGRSSSDWRTRELRMNIVAKHVPLKDLMQSIARVLGLRLTSSATLGELNYRLIGPQVEEEETPEEKAARELKKRRQAFFSQYMGLARANPRELEGLKEANPELYKLAKTPYGVPVARFLANVPAASMALVEGKQLVLRGRDISASAANDLLPALQGTPSAPTIPPPGSLIASPRGVPASMETMLVEINSNSSQGGTGLGEIRVTCNGKVVAFSFPDPTPAPVKAESTPPEPKPETKPDPIVDHPDEPYLHSKVKLPIKADSATLDEFDFAFAEASGFSVVSDSFASDGRVVVPKQEMELAACLQIFVDAFGQNWEKHGGIIEFRDRYWASKREKMISQAEQQKQPPANSHRDGPYPTE